MINGYKTYTAAPQDLALNAIKLDETPVLVMDFEEWVEGVDKPQGDLEIEIDLDAHFGMLRHEFPNFDYSL